MNLRGADRMLVPVPNGKATVINYDAGWITAIVVLFASSTPKRITMRESYESFEQKMKQAGIEIVDNRGDVRTKDLMRSPILAEA
jgi:hypothetical protein